jgi:2',3'-cyclic-nucleotide 2'-phosphodiesterase (5'-nucleotidase family)
MTLLFFFAACQSKWHVEKIEAEKKPITTNLNNDAAIESFIAPYRNHINKDLDSILSFAPVTLEKSKGTWQTNIGNMMADVCKMYGNKVFKSRYQKNIDVCLLNHGGIRNIIPSGNVTTRTAFEVMPFENSLVVLSLTGLQIKDLIHYFLTDKKPHPLAGLQLMISPNNELVAAKINNELIDDSKIYYVATSDYLANGGDNMRFFLEAQASFELDYKIRTMLIDYFKENDTIKANIDNRIIVQ